MSEQIGKIKTHVHFQLKYIIFFFALFTLISWSLQFIAGIYYKYYDKTRYYKITSPILVERKQNTLCSFVDAYVHRKVLVPIHGNSIRQLTLIREIDGRRERIRSYTTDIQAEVGEDTIVTHWKLPCDPKEAPFGTYKFEGTVAYKVNDYTKYEQFSTEPFEIIATPSALIIQ